MRAYAHTIGYFHLDVFYSAIRYRSIVYPHHLFGSAFLLSMVLPGLSCPTYHDCETGVQGLFSGTMIFHSPDIGLITFRRFTSYIEFRLTNGADDTQHCSW